MRLGGATIAFGISARLWFGELGMVISPWHDTASPRPRRSPWPGLAFAALLALGLLSAGVAGVWIVERALPHREQRP